MISQPPEHANTAYWLGIDVAKDTFQAALACAGQKWPATPLRELPVNQFSRTAEGVTALLDWLEPLLQSDGPIGVVMESTGKYSVELAVWLCEEDSRLQPAIVNAHQTSAYIKSMNIRAKTDTLEARALAFYGVEREPAPYQPQRPEQRHLRDLVRHRNHLVQQNLALTNRQSEGADTSFVTKAQKRIAAFFQRELKKVEDEMRVLVKSDPELARDVALLTSIYGVAFLTATTILAELGDLRRFERARQLTAFAGLNPRLVQSGSSINRPAHLSKKGNGTVRKALYMAALTAIKDKGQMQRTYETLIAKGKPKMVALAAVMRRLLVLMRAILINQTPYNPLWITS